MFDISEYSLQQATDTLDKLDHFIPNKKYLSSIENIQSTFDQNHEHYDLIWAIHSLSTVDKSQMKKVFEYLINLLEHNGKLLIFQTARQSCYYSLWDFSINNYSLTNAPELMAVEDTRNILDLLNISYETIPIHFEHVISKEDSSLLEMYLKREVLNNEVDVLNVFQDKLREYYDKESDRYVFPQQVDFTIANKKN